MAPAVRNPKKYLYEKAHEAAVVIRLTMPLLSESERETLEIMADPKTFRGIMRGLKEANEGKVVPLEKVLS